MFFIYLLEYYIVFIRSTVDGHLSCFKFLAIGNEATLNILVHNFWWTNMLISLGYVARGGISESYPSHSNVGEVQFLH